VPDIDPSDLARVELLRGPQGTFYGASSIGGLVKFVTVDPSTDSVSARVQTDVNSIHSGDREGYGVRAAVNVPLSDTFAVLVSAFTRGDPGYVNDNVSHMNGVNSGQADGLRLSALWKPAQTVSLKFSSMFQHTELNGSPAVDQLPGLGDLQQAALPRTG